ncbi:MAG: efflux RND transporter periplasmic adaptor subunit [Myxococcota bacterium]|nr:efflux RND transporter periplasmic adaptor subunit [Myxococcota bacterium]
MPRWLIVSAVSLGALALLLWSTVLAPERVPVKAVRVESGRVESTLSNTKAGTVRARRRAQLAPEVGGVVVEIFSREGARVEAGDPLIQLNDTTQRAQLALARESLRATQASVLEACLARDRAKRELERKGQLADKRVLSQDVLDGLQTAYQVGEASCHSMMAQAARAQAQVAVAESELSKLLLRAPFGGVVAELEVEVGEWVTPSPPLMLAPAVADLIDPSSLYVSAPMDEVDSSAIEPGQAVRVTVDSHPGRELAGRVARVAPYVLDVEAQNRTVEIEVELDDRELAAALLPGTSADVEVIEAAREDALRVPAPTLLAGDRVLVARDGRLVEQPVEIGLKNWDYAEIRDGLEAGQLVVISLERAEVRAGARVEVEETSYRP